MLLEFKLTLVLDSDPGYSTLALDSDPGYS